MFAVQKGKRNEFHVEERRIRRLVKNLYLNLLIVLMFYGLFHLLFREHPQYGTWIRGVLMLIFLLAGILVLLADIRAIGRAQRICCRLQEGGMEYFDGKKSHFYPWSSFRKVVWDKNRISLTYPCRFCTDAGSFYLYRWLGDQETLLPLMMQRLKGRAEIDPELPKFMREGFTGGCQ